MVEGIYITLALSAYENLRLFSNIKMKMGKTFSVSKCELLLMLWALKWLN